MKRYIYILFHIRDYYTRELREKVIAVESDKNVETIAFDYLKVYFGKGTKPDKKFTGTWWSPDHETHVDYENSKEVTEEKYHEVEDEV